MDTTIISAIISTVNAVCKRSARGRPRALTIEDVAVAIYLRLMGLSYRAIEIAFQGRAGKSTIHRAVIDVLDDTDFESEYNKILSIYDRLVGLDLSAISTDTSIMSATSKTDLTGMSPKNGWKLGVKTNVLVDANGVPLRIELARGSGSDFRELKPLLDNVDKQYLQHGGVLHADRGYDSQANRDLIRSEGLKPDIPMRRRRRESGSRAKPQFIVESGKRWAVEAFFGHLKRFRGVARLTAATNRRNLHMIYLGSIILIAKKIRKSNALRAI